MTVTLTYDAALARVRITADSLAAADVANVDRSTDQIMWTPVRGGIQAPINVRADVRATFGTVAANGWPVADTGQAWSLDGNPASDYSGTGSVGVQSHNAVNALHHTHIDTGSTDHQVEVAVTVPVVPTGSAITVRAAARFADTSNYFEAQILINAGGSTVFSLRKRVAGAGAQVGTTNVNLAAHSADNTWVITLLCSGPSLLAKARKSTDPDPGWLITETDTSLTTGTRVACLSRLETGNTNTLPVAISWDDVVAGPRVVQVDDYEFISGVPNYYRVRAVEIPPISYLGAAAIQVGNNSSLSVPQPSGLLPGDLKLIYASIRNSGTGTVNVPAGWQTVRAFGNVALLGKYHAAGDANPTVSFANGAANADTFAQMAAFRRADLAPVTGADQLNGSAQNIAYPALTVPADNMLILLAGWKQDDMTSIDAVAGGTEIGDANATAGDDASQAWDYIIQTTKANIAAGSFTVGGGAAAISRAMVVALQHAPYLNEQTAGITATLDSIWLKSVTRPFLNRKVTVVDWSPEERESRTGAFDAVGRTLEIAVTDVAGGLKFELYLHVSNSQDAQTLDYIRASGDILYLHTPAGCPVPGGHVCLDTTAARRVRPRGASRVFVLPLSQCAAPGPDVVGSTNNWAAVLASYPSWAALLAANPTWADLLARVAPPSVVIVS